jgi:hypothetical protein
MMLIRPDPDPLHGIFGSGREEVVPDYPPVVKKAAKVGEHQEEEASKHHLFSYGVLVETKK